MTIEVNSATILIIPMGDRIMRKHHLRFVVLYHCIVFYPLKAGFHFLCGLIMVAEDKILFAIKLIEHFKPLSVFPCKVTEDINFVAIGNGAVPICRHDSLHMVDVSKRSIVMAQDVLVSNVHIRYIKYWHFILSSVRFMKYYSIYLN